MSVRCLVEQYVSPAMRPTASSFEGSMRKSFVDDRVVNVHEDDLADDHVPAVGLTRRETDDLPRSALEGSPEIPRPSAV